jgi:hypothetical protein
MGFHIYESFNLVWKLHLPLTPVQENSGCAVRFFFLSENSRQNIMRPHVKNHVPSVMWLVQ